MPAVDCEISNLENSKANQWNDQIASLPGAHVLQTAQWGQVKAEYGWKIQPLIWRDQNGYLQAAALTMMRGVSLPGFNRKLNFLYIPKGPLLDWTDENLRWRVLQDLDSIARQKKAIFIKIDPDVRLGEGDPTKEQTMDDLLGQTVVEDFRKMGWRYSDEQIQFKNTILIDLTRDPDHLLSAMKPKTRYNIRLAERKGVMVRTGEINDLALLYRMYVETSDRDNFVIRDEGYYFTVWSTFMHAGMAEILIAEVNGKAVAGMVLFCFAKKAWFLYGMSGAEHREKMPNYLLQWEAMLRLKASGCQVYDLWGAPDDFTASDPLWGVYRFKEGLGGTVVRHIGAWDLPLRKPLYRLFTQFLPPLLNWMRWRGKVRTQRMLT